MAKYPSIEVGDPWTADLANAMLPDYVIKSVATLRPSTTTLADDPDLQTPTLLANATYLVEFSLRYATTKEAAIKTAWNVPAGLLSANRTVSGLGQISTTGALDNTPSGTTFSSRSGVHGYATPIGYGSRDSVSNQVELRETSVVIMGATAGVIAIQWAQLASTAVNTGVFATSYVRTIRLS